MINKILSFLIRAGITGILGLAIGVSLITTGLGLEIAIVIWIIGGIYTLSKFNDSFDIVILIIEKFGNKINDSLDNSNMKKIESNMLRVKKLYDNGILTQSEYEQKMQVLKDKYL